MPARIEDEDVVPFRLQSVVDRPRGWHGRSASLVAIALVGFVVTALVLGRALDPGPSGPRIAAVPSILPSAATPAATTAGPLPTASPEPAASPLPTRLVIGGRIPTERRLVYANGVQVLDLATGTLGPTTRPLYDHMLPVGDDQVVCACSLTGISLGETLVPPTVRFGRYDLTGRPIVERDLLSLGDVVPVPDVSSGFNVTTALSADRVTLYVLLAARRPPWWSIELYAVAVETGAVVSHVVLGRLPADAVGSGTPKPLPSGTAVPPDPTPDGIYVWTNALAAAPGGRSLYAAIGYVDYRQGTWNNQSREWMVPLGDGHPRTPIRLKADSLPAEGWCASAPRFVDRDLLVQACASGAGGLPDATYQLRRITADGVVLANRPIDGFPVDHQYPMVTALDAAARVLFIWDPVRHALGRVDVDSGAVIKGVVPASRLPGVTDFGGTLGIATDTGLALSPDGSQVYALGLIPNHSPAGKSTGIWVFDASTLRLLDHWEPRARLTSLAVSADGTFVYAASAQGFDTDGNARSSPASVTVYDATTGKIQVLYGAVSRDTWITFPSWP